MNSDKPEKFDIGNVAILPAQEEDFAEIRVLFRDGLDEGLVPDNDTGADIEILREAYLPEDGHSNFWVAKHNDYVIGMVGVQKTSPDAAEIRRLRVRKGYRRKGVGAKLMEEALGFCQVQHYLKIILDVRIEREPAIKLFEKFGFQHSRSREVNGRKMLDFYVDLYREPGS
ncbi:MAG: GNAT family N-acetyltransferase [Planctomycetes bacterium]|nr:GNAT family N-acetyltransferase [Planctomycetota bacterium]